MLELVTMPVKIDHIFRSKRRTISIQVLEDASLLVRAPNRVPQVVIQDFVESRENWILKQKHLAASRRSAPHQFSAGEGFLFLGTSYPLLLVDHQRERLHFNQAFHLMEKDLPAARQIFTNWYRLQAAQVFKERMALHSSLTGLSPSGMRLSSARTRWGSCSPVGRISLTWRLVMAPLEVIDYVIVHELVHLKVKNHSKTFWERVKVYYPSSAGCRKWLRLNGHLLVL